jgi:uncharacterized membrane protein YqhA
MAKQKLQKKQTNSLKQQIIIIIIIILSSKFPNLQVKLKATRGQQKVRKKDAMRVNVVRSYVLLSFICLIMLMPCAVFNWKTSKFSLVEDAS